jgi:hypothetical protein
MLGRAVRAPQLPTPPLPEANHRLPEHVTISAYSEAAGNLVATETSDQVNPDFRYLSELAMW